MICPKKYFKKLITSDRQVGNIIPSKITHFKFFNVRRIHHCSLLNKFFGSRPPFADSQFR